MSSSAVLAAASENKDLCWVKVGKPPKKFGDALQVPADPPAPPLATPPAPLRARARRGPGSVISNHIITPASAPPPDSCSSYARC